MTGRLTGRRARVSPDDSAVTVKRPASDRNRGMSQGLAAQGTKTPLRAIFAGGLPMFVPAGLTLAAWSVPAGVQTIAICMIIMTVGVAVTAAALVYAIHRFRRLVDSKVDEAMARVQPLVDQATSIAEQAKQTADSVSIKIDAVATKIENTAIQVGDRIQTVSERVESAISPQVVTAAGIVGAAAKCVDIYRDLLRLRDEGRARSSSTDRA